MVVLVNERRSRGPSALASGHSLHGVQPDLLFRSHFLQHSLLLREDISSMIRNKNRERIIVMAKDINIIVIYVKDEDHKSFRSLE